MSFDVIVIGARCAGSPTAMLLARRGLRVLLVDRCRFPRDTISTHMIHEAGIACLLRWEPSLVERLRASGCPPIVASRFETEHGGYRADHLPVEGNREAFAPRRTVLDSILVEAAAAAGCEVRTGFVVEGLLTDGDRVTGIRGRGRDGHVCEDRARIVVGADGKHSLVARVVGAPRYGEKPVTTCTYYSYWSGVSSGTTELYPTVGRMVVSVPTNDGLAVTTAIWPVARFDEIRRDVEKHFLDALAHAPELAERIRGGRREERFKGTADLPFYYRKPHGAGWALAGDAGLHKDPIIAQGITDAFFDAESLANALHAGLSGREPLERALDEHERRRNERTRDIYDYTHRLSLLEPPSSGQRALIAACARDPRLASRFHGIISGAVRYREFFEAEDVRAIQGST